jgi:hypothetical protein
MRKRGLSESVVWAHNPLPDVDDAALLAKAGLDMLTPKDKHPFALSWQFGGGLEREDISLLPGEFHPLRASESVEMQREMREQGLIMVNDMSDRAELLAKSEAGLRLAMTFWRDRGAPKLIQFRQRAGITDAEMEERKYDLWAYHVAKAKALLIEEKIKEIVRERAALAKPAKARAEAAAVA